MEDEAKVEGADRVDKALMVDADAVAAAMDDVVPVMIASLSISVPLFCDQLDGFLLEG